MNKVETNRKKTGGRKKGIPNKTTGELKDMILKALSNVGGIEYLEQRARENPVAFVSLLGRVLPLQVKGEMDHKGSITVNIKHY